MPFPMAAVLAMLTRAPRFRGFVLLPIVFLVLHSPATARQIIRFESLPQGLVIESEGPGYILGQPRSALMHRNGEFYVIEGTEAVVLRFDSMGHFVGRYGHQGSGPGEFRQPASLTIRGDSIVVWDPTLARLSVMTVDGQVVRMVPVRASGVGMLLPDGRVATMTDQAYGGAAELARQRVHIVVRDSLGAVADTILTRPRPYRSLQVRAGGGGVILAAQPFDDGPLFAVSQDRSRILQVTRTVSRDHTFALTVWDYRGRVVFTRRYSYRSVSLPSAEVDARVKALGARGGPDAEREVRRLLFVPDHLPTVTQAFFWPDGSIVLRREAEPGDRARYTVLDSQGRQRFEITVPSHVIPVSASGSRVAFFIRDDDGPYFRLVDVRH